MTQKYALNKIAYEVLVEMELESFTIVELRDLLAEKHSETFTERQLYQHLYQQMQTLYEHGYLNKSYYNDPREIIYEVTDKFSTDDFYPAKTTKLFSSYSAESSDSEFFQWVKNEHKKMSDTYENLTKTIAEYERIMSIHPSHKSYITTHYDEANAQLKDHLPKIQVLKKILSSA